MMKKLQMYSVFGLLLTAIFAAPAWAEPVKIKISFASPYATYCSPYLIAKDFGWFKELGLETEDVILNGDANATRALITGSSDVAMTGPLNVFNAIENGAEIKWIGSWQTTVDYVVVAGKSIQSLKDLQSKTFASSGPSGLPQVLPSMLFKKMGVPTNGLKFVSVGGHSARLQAVVAGIRHATGTVPAEPAVFWGYVVTQLVLLPAAALWAFAERSRWSSVVLLVAAVAVAFLQLRLNRTWGS